MPRIVPYSEFNYLRLLNWRFKLNFDSFSPSGLPLSTPNSIFFFSRKEERDEFEVKAFSNLFTIFRCTLLLNAGGGGNFVFARFFYFSLNFYIIIFIIDVCVLCNFFSLLADGVVLIDQEYVKDRKVFGHVLAAFRYGREDLDVLGLTFRKDLYLAAEQIYPQDINACRRPLTRLQVSQSRGFLIFSPFLHSLVLILFLTTFTFFSHDYFFPCHVVVNAWRRGCHLPADKLLSQETVLYFKEKFK